MKIAGGKNKSINKGMERLKTAHICLCKVAKRYLPNICQLLPFTIQGVSHFRLHVVETASLARHFPQYISHHLKRHGSRAYQFEYISRSGKSAVHLRKLVCQRLHNRNTRLSKLTQFLASQYGSGSYLTKSQDKTVHVNTQTDAQIGQAFRGIKQFTGWGLIGR